MERRHIADEFSDTDSLSSFPSDSEKSYSVYIKHKEKNLEVDLNYYDLSEDEKDMMTKYLIDIPKNMSKTIFIASLLLLIRNRLEIPDNFSYSCDSIIKDIVLKNKNITKSRKFDVNQVKITMLMYCRWIKNKII